MKNLHFALPIPVLVLLSVFLYRAPSRTASGTIDVDYYWHLGYGEWILDHGHLPTVDFWSWTFAGHTYNLTQWLGEVIMAIAHRAGGGELGTQLLSAALVTLTIAFGYLAARAFLENRLAAMAVAFACDAILISLACRPHQFTHLGLAILTAILAHYHVRGDRRLLYAVPPVMAVWANLHGGYAVGLAYLWVSVGFVAADAYMTHRHEDFKRTILPLALAALAGTVATLANPYGLGAWQYAIDIASMKSSSAGIVDEWGPTNIKMDVGLNWFIASTAVFGAMAASSRRPSLAALLCAVTLIAVGWSALRLSLMMSVLLVPLLAASLRHTAFYTLTFDGAARLYDRSVRPLASLGILALVLGVAIVMAKGDKTSSQYITANLPEQEVAFMKANHISGRIMNNAEIGGYLIRNLGQRVFLDTRYDLYGDRALFDFLFARRGEAGWREFVTRHDPDVFVLDNISSLRQLLTDTGMYRLVFEGPRYSVLVRPSAYSTLPSITASPGRRSLLDLLKT